MKSKASCSGISDSIIQLMEQGIARSQILRNWVAARRITGERLHSVIAGYEKAGKKEPREARLRGSGPKEGGEEKVAMEMDALHPS